ncbi:MAG TPA: hypothetical protein VF179_05795 [Thermoanaerobaculia bacterium]|nr:hypothetical protein [Thermoanaerobaculia bacterium]
MKVPLAKFQSRALARFVMLGVIVLGTGCASVDTGPFTQFASSLQSLRTGIDSQAGAAAMASRQGLVEKVATGKVSPADLQLEFVQSNPFAASYGFAEDEPNFAKLIRYRQGLAALNDVMIAYAQSLVVLSGGGQGVDILPTSAQFDQMAQSLNANAGTAASALRMNIGSDQRALLSTAAVQLFKAYIENKRRKDLAEAIGEVQPRIDEFSLAAQEAVHFLASMVQTDYTTSVLPLTTVNPPNATPILNLNDTTQATLATLAALSSGYGAVRDAHRDLKAATAKKPSGLSGLIALTNEAIRLQGFVNQLAKANAAAAAGTQ